MVGQRQNGLSEEAIQEDREHLQNRRLFEDAKWFKVLRKGREREIVLFIVVELFRFIFYLWFVVFFIVGLTLTHGFTPYLEEESNTKKTVTKVFGNINDSGIFGIPPWTYVLPTFYTIQVVLIFLYSILSVFRAWIAKLENKISCISFILYSCVFGYFCLSAAIFSTIFSVQPDVDKPETLFLHTLPFTNLIISLTLLQIAVTWFGQRVSWKDFRHHLKISRIALKWGSIAFMVGLIVSSTLKVLHQINALADLDFAKEDMKHGAWLNVHTDSYKTGLEVVDKLWLVMALLCPMIQSLYLTLKGLDTHGIIITVRDNREANQRQTTSKNQTRRNRESTTVQIEMDNINCD